MPPVAVLVLLLRLLRIVLLLAAVRGLGRVRLLPSHPSSPYNGSSGCHGSEPGPRPYSVIDPLEPRGGGRAARVTRLPIRLSAVRRLFERRRIARNVTVPRSDNHFDALARGLYLTSVRSPARSAG